MTTTTTTSTTTTTTTTTPSYQSDPCYQIKDIIDGMSVTKDDGATAAGVIVMWGETDEPMERLFDSYDAIIIVCPRPLRGRRQIQSRPIEYIYRVPVTVFTKDKAGVTGEYLQWEIEKQIRTLLENNAQSGSVHITMDDGRDRTAEYAGTTVQIIRYRVEYQT